MRVNSFDLLRQNANGIGPLLQYIDDAFTFAPKSQFPAFDLVRQGEAELALSLTVAGFDQSELTIEVENGILSISGAKEDKAEANYIVRGIAKRNFRRQFSLPDQIEIGEATLKNGILTLGLHIKEPVRDVRKVDISAAA